MKRKRASQPALALFPPFRGVYLGREKITRPAIGEDRVPDD